MSPLQTNDDPPIQLDSASNVETYGRFIVVYEDDISVVETYDGIIMDDPENVDSATVYLPLEHVDQVRKQANILSVEADQLVSVEPQRVTWGNERIQLPNFHNHGLTGEGVNISIVDTGIAQHEDLTISGGATFVFGTNSYDDDNGHGTHVAGIVAANDNDIGIVGVAPEASIYALKSLNEDGLGYLSDIIAAIDWSIDHNMDIINLSLGMQRESNALKNAVDKAYEKNILVVGAGGNDGNPQGIGDIVAYPARYDSVIAVAATNQYNRRGSFSATGPTVEVSAPGVNILSTYLHNNYVQLDGTSMAAPYVTGTLALLKQHYPDMDVSQLRKELRENTLDLGEPGRDPWFGYGLIQLPEPIIPDDQTQDDSNPEEPLPEDPTIPDDQIQDDPVPEEPSPDPTVPKQQYFQDTIGHWANDAIHEVYERGWMKGTGGNLFSPKGKLTRAQAAVILVRVLNLTSTPEDIPFFHDIYNHWAREEIEIIAQHRIMRGLEANQFAPETPMTREQMATMLSRILQLERTAEMQNPFTDVVEGHWASNAIIAAAHHQVFKGKTATTFAGKEQMDRAQMATLLQRLTPQLTNQP
ncbi:S8 family peptidase [Desertibacillus haloalkaliphilus]|uniref:S8 family peptidase n=1 Tax=Desertibacillus haloalkaliphilus TaxID=1328930 RepID=UPI001C27A8E3|nr:S8 family serine peptidase [Desertibacillus haloalkaliphilus]MBU8905411.1 S8 family serine peptidase [Desertibacillus haloalkaliphilus]